MYTIEQWTRAADIIGYVKIRKNKNTKSTLDEIEKKFGVKAEWRRVTWAGGVGSYKFMRSKRLRIQVSANQSGYQPARLICTNSGHVVRVKGKKFFKYAYCVEV